MDETDVKPAGAVVPPAVAIEAADRTNKRASDFNGLTQQANANGGVAAPEQRIQLAQSLQAVQPETSVLKAMAQAFLGNPNARHIASQGRISNSTVYDVNGDPIFATFAENSPIPLKAVDVNTGKELSYQDWTNRKGGQFTSYADTFGGQAGKISTTKRAEYNEQEAGITNLQNAAAAPLKDLYSQQRADFQKLGELAQLGSDELNEFASMASGTASISSSLSGAYNTMKQAQKDKGTKEALTKSGSLQAAINILSSRGKISKEKVANASSSELDQIYNNAASAQGLEASYSQNQAEAITSAWYRKLDDNGKRLFENIFQRAKQIDKFTAQAGKLGDLNIAADPYSPDVLKQAGSGELQAAMGEFKADATQAFARWREKQNFPAGTLPAIGALQSAFTRTQEYKDLVEKYHGIADDIEKRAAQNVEKHKDTPSTKATIGAVPVDASGAVRPVKDQLPRNTPPAAKKPSSDERVQALTQSILNSLNPKKGK